MNNENLTTNHMTKNIFITSTGKQSGKSTLCAGLYNTSNHIIQGSMGYFKPLGTYAEKKNKQVCVDKGANLLAGLMKSKLSLEDICPVSTVDAAEMILKRDKEKLMSIVLEGYEKIAKDKEIVMIEGLDIETSISTMEFDINVDIANSLNAGVLLVADGNVPPDDIIRQVLIFRSLFLEHECDFLGIIINRADLSGPEKKDLIARFKKEGVNIYGIIPYTPILSKPILSDLIEPLDAKVLFNDNNLTNRIESILTGAMHTKNFIDHLEKADDGALVLTPGDREDIFLPAVLSRLSSEFNNISGIVLSGGFIPGKSTISLLKGIEDLQVPVLSTSYDTYDASKILNGIMDDVRTKPDDIKKNTLIADLIDEHVDITKLYVDLNIERTKKTTPETFIYKIIKQARSDKKKIVLPESSEKRILLAAENAVKRGIADIILIGSGDVIFKQANLFGVDIKGMEIIDQSTSILTRQYAKKLFQLRKDKGVTRERALDMVHEPIYFGTMMVETGYADGLVSGAVHSTADTIRPALQLIKLKKGISIASSIFFMCLPNKVITYGDCALMIDPTAEELVDIAIMSAETARSFWIEPRIAMLSYSTGESGKGADVDKVKKATDIIKKKRPDLNVEGPIQYDAAISSDIAKVKIKDSKVAGHANVYIFPDLNSGNIACKAVQQSSNIMAVGPLLQGTIKPFNDLSRGATIDDIIYTIGLTAIQAQSS